jgi:hypothetical protein
MEWGKYFLMDEFESRTEAMIKHYKNTIKPSRETALVITKMEEALLWHRRNREINGEIGQI